MLNSPEFLFKGETTPANSMRKRPTLVIKYFSDLFNYTTLPFFLAAL